jgi:hypothetical protein
MQNLEAEHLEFFPQPRVDEQYLLQHNQQQYPVLHLDQLQPNQQKDQQQQQKQQQLIGFIRKRILKSIFDNNQS